MLHKPMIQYSLHTGGIEWKATGLPVMSWGKHQCSVLDTWMQARKSNEESQHYIWDTEGGRYCTQCSEWCTAGAVAENSLLSRTASVASENSFRTDFQAFLTQQIQPFAGEDAKHRRSGSATLSCSNIHTQQEGWTLLKWCCLEPK